MPWETGWPRARGFVGLAAVGADLQAHDLRPRATRAYRSRCVRGPSASCGRARRRWHPGAGATRSGWSSRRRFGTEGGAPGVAVAEAGVVQAAAERGSGLARPRICAAGRVARTAVLLRVLDQARPGGCASSWPRWAPEMPSGRASSGMVRLFSPRRPLRGPQPAESRTAAGRIPPCAVVAASHQPQLQPRGVGHLALVPRRVELTCTSAFPTPGRVELLRSMSWRRTSPSRSLARSA